MPGNSATVCSNQTGPHERVAAKAAAHLESAFLKPISVHTKQAFERADSVVKEHARPVILDSGCGAGDSTIFLAKKFQEHFVIGLDKSTVRLRKASLKENTENMLFVRADQFDFWRLLVDADWNIEAHYLFYPNPWPKKRHLGRRIQGHPAFSAFINVAEYVEVRSNWIVYLEELAIAFETAGTLPAIEKIQVSEPVTLFEKKFVHSRQDIYRFYSQPSEKFLWI